MFLSYHHYLEEMLQFFQFFAMNFMQLSLLVWVFSIFFPVESRFRMELMSFILFFLQDFLASCSYDLLRSSHEQFVAPIISVSIIFCNPFYFVVNSKKSKRWFNPWYLHRHQMVKLARFIQQNEAYFDWVIIFLSKVTKSRLIFRLSYFVFHPHFELRKDYNFNLKVLVYLHLLIWSLLPQANWIILTHHSFSRPC